MSKEIEMIEENLTGFMNVQQGLKAPKDIKKQGVKYVFRNAEDILEKLKPLLKENNAVVIVEQEIITQSDILIMKSTAIYKDHSGQHSASSFAGIDKNTKFMGIAQSFGSSSSYSKKYALCNLFAIDDSKDDPDNGNVPVNNKQDNEKAIKDEKGIKQFFLKSYKPAFNDLTVNFNGQDKTLLYINQNIEKAPLDIVEMAIELIKFQGN